MFVDSLLASVRFRIARPSFEDVYEWCGLTTRMRSVWYAIMRPNLRIIVAPAERRLSSGNTPSEVRFRIVHTIPRIGSCMSNHQCTGPQHDAANE